KAAYRQGTLRAAASPRAGFSILRRRTTSLQAVFRRRRHQPRIPRLAKISDKRTLGQRDYGAKAKKSVLASEVQTSTLLSSPTVSGGGLQRRDNDRPSSSSPPPPLPPALRGPGLLFFTILASSA